VYLVHCSLYINSVFSVYLVQCSIELFVKSKIFTRKTCFITLIFFSKRNDLFKHVQIYVIDVFVAVQQISSIVHMPLLSTI